MNGLFAIRSSSGEPHETARTIAARALTKLEHRACDGCQIDNGAEFTLAIAYTRSLPEDPIAPTVFNGQGLRLICDARLDNREVLISELGLDPSVSEGQILLAAYQTWGHSCASHLLGDFAFIVVNDDLKTLFAARDHLGIRPLFYREDTSGLLIASELSPLINPGAPFTDLSVEEPLQTQIADLIIGELSEGHQVMYEKLWRVPPGHTLYQEQDRPLQLTAYWRPTPLKNPNELTPAAFREIFRQSVDCRLRSIHRVASNLSGGLDSSSISCVAANILKDRSEGPLPTLSAVFGASYRLSERKQIEAVIAMGGIAPHLFDFEGYNPLKGIEGIIDEQVRLNFAPGLVMTRSLLDGARNLGIGVVLDGHGGDEVISHGMGRLNELARRGAWGKLWRNLAPFAQLYGDSRAYMFFLYLARFGRFKGSYSLRKIARFLQSRLEGVDRRNFLGSKLRGLNPSPLKTDGMNEMETHQAFLQSSGRVHSIEVLTLNAAHAGIELRLPFFDKRLVEFCLSLPAEAKLNNGWMRLILREAMQDILPPLIQWRKDKFDFTSHIAVGLLDQNKALLSEVADATRSGLEGYINQESLQKSYRSLSEKRSRASGVDLQLVFSATALSIWLKKRIRKSIQ